MITASAVGAEANPARYVNLLVNPTVTIERWQGGVIESAEAKAMPTEGAERDRL